MWQIPAVQQHSSFNFQNSSLISLVREGFEGLQTDKLWEKNISESKQRFFPPPLVVFISFSAYGGNYFQAGGCENKQNTTNIELNVYK